MNVVRRDIFQNRSRSLGRMRGRGAEVPRSQTIGPREQNPFRGRLNMVTPQQMVASSHPQNMSYRYSIGLSSSSANARKRPPWPSSSSGSGTRSRTTSSEIRTPKSATSSSNDVPSSCIVALTEGRGQARGEVGVAALDVNCPNLILCQISDNQTYTNTLTKINVFNPVEILVPNTFCEGQTQSKLYSIVQEAFPMATVTSIIRRHFRDTEGLKQIQQLCAVEFSSVELVVSQKFYALASAAALLKYVEYLRCVLFSPKSLKVEYQGTHNRMVIDMKTAQHLELIQSLRGSSSQYSLMGVLNHCRTNGGIRLLRSNILEPPCLLQTIVTRLDCVQEIVEKPELRHSLELILPKFHDVNNLLSLCMHMPQQESLEVAEAQMKYTLLLKTTLELLPSLNQAIQDCESSFFHAARESLADVRYRLIGNKILTVLHDDARTAKGAEASQMQCNFAIKGGISDMLDLARQTYCEIVDDISALVASLAEQYNLPLKVNYTNNWGYHIQLSQSKRSLSESDLPPIFVQIHKTRSTLSFTTQDLIQAERRSKDSMKHITMQSNIIICNLLADIRKDIGCLFKLCEVIAEIDMLTSFANISAASTYVRPRFGRVLDLKQSKHPILDYVSQYEPVPNDVYSSDDYNCHIITGPNMGGKSIYIRQIALLQIMAQIGCYIPAQSATLRISDHLFSRLNFDDSIECNASTFVLELKEFKYIKQMLTPLSLVIVDELCRGTSCEEGTAIAWTIIEELMDEDAFIFITTHFLYLTKLEELYCNVTNHHFEALEKCTESGVDRLVYTHKLLPGVTQLENYGLRLAQNLAFPSSVLEKAKELAQELASRRKAFGSASAVNTKIHRYYKLTSIAKEYARDGALTAQKLQELKIMFSDLKIDDSGDNDEQIDTENPIPEGSATESAGVTKDFCSDTQSSFNVSTVQKQRNKERRTPSHEPRAKRTFNEVLDGYIAEVESLDIDKEDTSTDKLSTIPDCEDTGGKSKCDIYHQERKGEETPIAQKCEAFANIFCKNIFYSEPIITQETLNESEEEAEAMEVDCNIPQGSNTFLSPVLSLPDESYSFKTLFDVIDETDDNKNE